VHGVQLLGFFLRGGAGDARGNPGFDAVDFPSLDAFLWRPVMAGMWRQHELFDGTYSFDDLLQVHEFLDTREENERLYWEWRKNHPE
jgi:hypothetical protein